MRVRAVSGDEMTVIASSAMAASSSSVVEDVVTPTLFALSIVPYAYFLVLLRKAKIVPRVAVFGFDFLLVFVGVSIPAAIVARNDYGSSLSDVDWLHGSAESFLSVTNCIILIGFTAAIRAEEEAQRRKASAPVDRDEQGDPS